MSASKKTKEVKRSLKGTKEVHHDLFKLDTENTKKNVSFTAQPLWEPIPHKHFYHTVDSDGKPQDRCAPSAGHFHKVEIKEVDGEFVGVCSKPYKMVVKNGRRVEVPYGTDEHTHDIVYLQSEVVQQRVFDQEAMKVISHIKNQEAQRMKNPAL